MPKYIQIHDGDWVRPIRRGYKFCCCDCGLVHELNFRLIRSKRGKRFKIEFQAFRHERSTAQIRRHMKK